MTMYEAYSAYRGTGADFAPDALVLKKLRLRVEADDQQHPPLKKLKICGMDLEELPPEVFHLFELEVRTPTFKLLGSYIIYCFPCIALFGSKLGFSRILETL